MGDSAWVELQIELPAAAAELVAAELSEALGGVELRDAETLLSTAAARAAVVALCRPDQQAEMLALVDDVLATARAAGSTVDPVTVRERPAHEEEWRDVWKQFFRTTRVGRRFVVRPSWDIELGNATGAAPDEIIELDPGRAFGTGAHPSTRLVIAAMERLHAEGFAPQRFLDLGCGSGILAIAAHRLWPQARGLAVDLDPEAVGCTRENLERNHVPIANDARPGAVEPRVGELGAIPESFDLVLANIQRDVLDPLAPQFQARVTAGGRLVLSGLLDSDAAPIEARFREVGFSPLGRSDEGEWASWLLAAGAV